MVQKLMDNVFCLGDSDYEKPILGLVSGNKYSLVIDAGDSPEHARSFQNKIEHLGVAPVRYLAITHHHSDHTAGLSEWRQVISISSMATMEKIQGVDLGFHSEMVIDLGGVTCLMKVIPSSHCKDATIVYVKEKKVLFLGDALYTSRVNNKFHYSKKETLLMIDLLENYDTDSYVFSHIPLCEPDRLGMKIFLTKLKFIAELADLGYTIQSLQKAFLEQFGRQATQDEVFIMNCLL